MLFSSADGNRGFTLENGFRVFSEIGIGEQSAVNGLRRLEAKFIQPNAWIVNIAKGVEKFTPVNVTFAGKPMLFIHKIVVGNMEGDDFGANLLDKIAVILCQ